MLGKKLKLKSFFKMLSFTERERQRCPPISHRLGSKIRTYPHEHVTLEAPYATIGGLTVALCWAN
ncbi:hypothetical protein CEQ90_20385, partial [Lewinellaceae bacterium SD302]